MLENFQKKTIKNQHTGRFGNHLGGARGDPPGPQAPSRRALRWGCARGSPGPLVPPWLPPSPMYSLSRETFENRTLYRDLASVPPSPRFQDRERQQTSSRHPAGGRIDLWELLLHHGRFPDDP